MPCNIKKVIYNYLNDTEKKNFEENVVVSTDEAELLCLKTVKQNTDLWRNERKIRITSSCVHKIYGAKKDDTWLKYFKDNKSIENVTAIGYGIQMESEARRKYENVTGNTVFIPGLCVKTD